MSDDGRRSRSPSPARQRSRSPVREDRGARPEEPAKLFIGNLSFDTTNDSLADAFSKHGPVVEARVVTDRETGRSRGFGFVTFENVADAEDAVSGMAGFDLQGREIRVDRTNANAPRGGRGGGRGGDRGGRGGYGGDRGGYGGDRGGYGGDRGGYGGDRGGRGGGGGGDRPRGACYAFQKGECRYGDSCRFAHN